MNKAFMVTNWNGERTKFLADYGKLRDLIRRQPEGFYVKGYMVDMVKNGTLEAFDE